MWHYIWQRRWLGLAFTILVLLLVISGVAYGVGSIQKVVPATVTVSLDVAPEGALGFYSDAAGTIPVTTLDFGTLRPGATGMVSVWGRNLTSATTFTQFSVTDDLGAGVATMSPQVVTSNPGSIIRFDFFLTLAEGTPDGVYSFTVTVTAFASPY